MGISAVWEKAGVSVCDAAWSRPDIGGDPDVQAVSTSIINGIMPALMDLLLSGLTMAFFIVRGYHYFVTFYFARRPI